VTPIPSDRPAATVYYLDHFLQVLEAVRTRHGFLLDSVEYAHLTCIGALSTPAQMLYARLVNRRGPCFRQDRLSYPEIPRLDAAIAELSSHALLTPCDTELEAEFRPRLYGCFTVAELRSSLADHRPPRPSRKGDLLAWLEMWDGRAAWLSGLLVRHPVLRLPARDPWPFFRFLFFGELRDNLADFVTRELGFIVTESVAAEKLRAQFETRRAAVDAYRMACLYARFRSLRDAQPALETWHWWQAQAVDRAALTAGLAQFDRLVDRLGRRLERANELEASLSLYATSPVAPARERQARLLLKTGRRAEAMTILQMMTEHPGDAEEAYIARQLLARLGKTARRSEARQYQQSGRQIILEDAGQTVESATLGHYRRAGWHGVHSENWLWNAAFGLLFWDIIYDADAGVFHSPLQFAPADLYEPGFYDRRRLGIEQRLCLLHDPSASFAVIARHHEEKAGLANPFVHWQADLLPLIRIMIHRLPAPGLGAILRRLAQDIKRRSRGFPDLFLWTTADYRFVEVKSENDQLSAAQYQWLRFLAEAGIPVSLENVRRTSV
jgi:VRR-NUC domain